MKIQDLKKLKLPENPGVYFFLGPPKQSEGGKKGNLLSQKATARQREILYIGKATSLRDRTRSYFGKDLIATRGPLLVDMVVQADKLEWQETDSVLEALILEASLIKKHQPKYNTKEKDNKSFNYVCITREALPKVLIVRGRKLDAKKYQSVFGPFISGMQLKEAMRIIRRIFPYIDASSSKKQNYEFYRQLGLTPELNPLPTSPLSRRGEIQNPPDKGGRGVYLNNIKNLRLFFQGKKKQIIINFKKEMMVCAKKKEFEKAGEIKRKIFALEHINDVALIKEAISTTQKTSQNNPFEKVLGSPRKGKREARPDHFQKHYFVPSTFRIEAYDIAHMSGQNMVGVMVVVEDGEVEKSEYKKFIIKTVKGANDPASLKEVLTRRFNHPEWKFPNLIVVDGNDVQKNVALKVLKEKGLKIDVVSVVKDEKHKAKAILFEASSRSCLGLLEGKTFSQPLKKAILLANSEAHRFAISFYRQKSRKNMLK